jgi:hypothetical protein
MRPQRFQLQWVPPAVVGALSASAISAAAAADDGLPHGPHETPDNGFPLRADPRKGPSVIDGNAHQTFYCELTQETR